MQRVRLKRFGTTLFRLGRDRDSHQVPTRSELVRGTLESVAREVVGRFIEPACRKWADLVETCRLEDARVDPLVTIVSNDHWVEFTMRYVDDHRGRRVAKDELFSRILGAIGESDGKRALASGTFHLIEDAPLEVSFEPRARTTGD